MSDSQPASIESAGPPSPVFLRVEQVGAEFLVSGQGTLHEQQAMGAAAVSSVTKQLPFPQNVLFALAVVATTGDVLREWAVKQAAVSVAQPPLVCPPGTLVKHPNASKKKYPVHTKK